ncbi:hypothetical protein PEPS_39110 (plasmid) [Persicobacter psychrovividus]|uniref:Uncharacterized protein n=1 Tax=Persicobacter psychrovividus TaxID=387638 RepID=A0ABM7VKZ1_9BACT|nr:hypothetical protein PEPS_39110 [Persicobacter psychrovividus]
MCLFSKILIKNCYLKLCYFLATQGFPRISNNQGNMKHPPLSIVAYKKTERYAYKNAERPRPA